jgi:hypothetical protein
MLRNIFNKSFTKPLLGRWNRAYDTSTAIKVNWANVDHCGTCSKEDLTIKYIEYNPVNISKQYRSSSIEETNLEESMYCVEAFYEPVQSNTMFKVKENKYTKGIEYFLTRNKL